MTNKKMTEIEEALVGVFASAMRKYRKGEDKHGVFVPETDQRNLLAEMEEEILDAINYLGMFAVQQRKLRAMVEELAVRKGAQASG